MTKGILLPALAAVRKPCAVQMVGVQSNLVWEGKGQLNLLALGNLLNNDNGGGEQ